MSIKLLQIIHHGVEYTAVWESVCLMETISFFLSCREQNILSEDYKMHLYMIRVEEYYN